MALYEVTLRQRYFDQLSINVFSYFSPTGGLATPSALELLTLMGFIPSGDPLAFPDGSIADLLWNSQVAETLFLSVEARELYSVTDFYEAAYSPAIPGGNDGGQGAPPFVAMGLYTARVRLDVKRGFKRFVGIGESFIDAGGVINSGMLAGLSALAEGMSDVLGGVSAFYNPCVISREKVIDPEDGKVSYELYPTEAEQEEHIAYPLVWTPYNEVRSQVSRQYGRGQ